MAFDEMRGTAKSKRVRAPYRNIAEWLDEQPPEDLQRKSAEAEALFRRTGITFAVYGSADPGERLIPFDIIPRILSASEWRRLAAVELGPTAARGAGAKGCARSVPS